MRLKQNVDWIGLSFVQRPEDLAEARKLMGPAMATLCAKIEKTDGGSSRLSEIIETV